MASTNANGLWLQINNAFIHRVNIFIPTWPKPWYISLPNYSAFDFLDKDINEKAQMVVKAPTITPAV